MTKMKQGAANPPRRTQRACQLCHVTKVRCDAVAGSGNPCTNCSQKGANCVVDQRARKRRRVHHKSSIMLSKKTGDEALPGSGIVSMLSPATPSNRKTPNTEFGEFKHGYVHQPFIHTNMNTFPPPDPTAGWLDLSQSPTTPKITSFNNVPFFSQPEEEVWNEFTNIGSPQSSSEEEENQTTLLPRFIQPLPMMMSPASIECLYMNGVFTLPGIPLQNELLQTFIDCVLPSMPIIELEYFLSAIQYRENSAHSISLLLFYAVMMSATTFVDQGHLYEAGFSARAEAQELFYQKAKLLYQNDYELNAMTTVQALLLLSYRLKSGDGLDSRHWTSVAISTAQSIGLFHDASARNDPSINPGLWRRMAWTCYASDCQTALRLRCRPFITGPEFCHQMLTEDDFDLYSFGNDTQSHGLGLPRTQESCIQRETFNLFIAQARLCTTINGVLHLQAERNASPGSPIGNSPPATRFEEPEFLARVSTNEMRLAEWTTCFPPVEVDAQSENPTLFLQRNLLHLQFYTAIAVFYQSQPLPSSSFCVKHAAQQITRISTKLFQSNLHNRLPIIGVTAILVALIIHVTEMKSLPSAETGESTQNFQSGLEVLKGLRDVYREASLVTSWASKIMNALNHNSAPPADYAYSERRSSAQSVNMTYPLQMNSAIISITQ